MSNMRKIRKLSFSDLVNENKLEILKNKEELERIERLIEEKRMDKAQKSP